jgi:hypothetical protein
MINKREIFSFFFTQLCIHFSDRKSRIFLFYTFSIDNKIFRIAEAACGYTSMLLIDQYNPFTGKFINSNRHFLAPDTKKNFSGI